MKYRLISILAILALLCVTSCMQDHPDIVDVSKEIKVSASIDDASNLGVKTRVSDNTWNDGDAIGIFMTNTGETLSTSSLALNAKYVTTNGADDFSPAPSNAIIFPFQEEKVDFIAYYPYKSTLDGLTYPVDVSDQSKLANIDLLYSNNVTNINSLTEQVKLSFVHQLSKVVLNISMEAGGPELSGLKVGITNVNATASFSLIDGMLTDDSSQEPSTISFNMSNEGLNAEAILLPNTSLSDKKLVFTLGEFSYTFDLSKATIKKFDKSTKYTLNVTLKPGVGVTLDSITTSIQDWTNVAPDDPITADEDKKVNPNPTDNTPTDSPEGDNNDETEGTTEQAKGDGTKENPYTVEQAQQKVGEQAKWVKGYIVGSYGSTLRRHNFIPGAEGAGKNNVAIARTSTETDSTKTFVIDLITDAAIGINNISLLNNKNNLGKEVYLQGNIANPYGSVLLNKIRRAIIDGEPYGDK